MRKLKITLFTVLILSTFFVLFSQSKIFEKADVDNILSTHKEKLKKEATDGSILVESKIMTFDRNVKSTVSKKNEHFYAITETTEEKKIEYGTYIGLKTIAVNQQVVFKNGGIYDFEENERVVYNNSNVLYTQKSSYGETKLRKYKISSNNLLLEQKLNFPFEYQDIRLINTESPSFLISDSEEGGGFTYKLYSQNFKKKLEYIPFEHGFRESLEAFYKDKIIIITQNWKKSGEYKFCLINTKHGIIENEQIVNFENDVLFSVSATEVGFLVTGLDKNNYKKKAILFNDSFSELWQVTINKLFSKAYYFSDNNLFYCRIGSTTLLLINKEGEINQEININKLYPFKNEELLGSERITVKSLVSLKDNTVGVLIAIENQGVLKPTWRNVALVVLENNKAHQTIILPESSSSLSIEKEGKKNLKLHFENKTYYYEIH